MAERSTVGDVDVVECIIRYFYNVDPADQIKALLGDVDEDYMADWIDTYQAGFQHWWGRMDDDNKQKYVQNARARYWEEILQRRVRLDVAASKRLNT